MTRTIAHCRRNRIEPKKAIALISIWEAYNAKTLTMEKIGEVGWCKLMLIAPKLGAVYNKKFGQWKLCHDQWCKPGETSVVATILSSRDEEADGRVAKLIAERFNEALELRIPMKPATDSKLKPASHSDFIPAGDPI